MAAVAKPIVSVLVQTGSNESLDMLAGAIRRKNERRLFVAELAEEPTQPGIEPSVEPPPEPVKPGLVPCDACERPVAPRDGHYQVHYPDGKTSTPCPRSWPSTGKKP